ncbi:MAG TPA: hypothetical protein G4N94_02760 [Caldilineae bacterium]|nr:hypothetical protein [Caldilineae bacterium]
MTKPRLALPAFAPAPALVHDAQARGALRRSGAVLLTRPAEPRAKAIRRVLHTFQRFCASPAAWLSLRIRLDAFGKNSPPAGQAAAVLPPFRCQPAPWLLFRAAGRNWWQGRGHTTLCE